MNESNLPGSDTDLWIENHPLAELDVGRSASLTRTVTKADIVLFAKVSGDVNPAHVDAAYAKSSRFGEIIAHGMLGGSLISTVLGTKLPGPGTIYLGQTLRFLRPVHVDDALTVTVASIDTDRRRVLLDTRCIDAARDGGRRGIHARYPAGRQLPRRPVGTTAALARVARNPGPRRPALAQPLATGQRSRLGRAGQCHSLSRQRGSGSLSGACAHACPMGPMI